MRRSASEIVDGMERRRDLELDRLAAMVMSERDMRWDQCETVPMKRRGRKKRRVPKTSIIGEAANRLIARRKFMETLKRALVSREQLPQEQAMEAFEYAEKFFKNDHPFRETI